MSTRTVAECGTPGCTGTWHDDDACVTELPEVEFDGTDVCLASELVAYGGGAPSIVTFAFNATSHKTRREMSDRVSAAAFTAQLRLLADAIDSAAAVLPSGEAS
ncbi:hypothetical protein [Streptomyces griseoflavus]|uniref:hypothetical protein n=1 Tax=Streptomyces griseoflavus TaxID=35619 RepID=UPI0033C36D3E